jgi:protein TonB
MKTFMTVLFLIIYSSAYTQAVDTIYFDKYWKKVSPTYYAFYRIITPVHSRFNVEDYYRSGALQMQGTYSSLDPKEVKEGHFTYYTEDGILTIDEYYHEGLREGLSMSYDTLNHFTYKKHFKKGMLEDTLIGYYPTHDLRRIEIYRGGKMTSGQCYDEKGNEIPFFPQRITPEYPGGDKAMEKFIKRHLEYPEADRKANIEGRVVVSFIVETDGSLTNIRIAKGVDELLNNSAIDIVRRFPQFKSGQIEGKPVRVSFILPIMFKLEEY